MSTATPAGPVRLGPVLWEIGTGHRGDMRVPVRILADEILIGPILDDLSVEQLVNVATLPGIARPALGMPDMHQGYGFPVGGVAAMRTSDGVISPGGIGFDINCGVRLLATGVRHVDVRDRIPPLVHELSRSIPTGYGRRGRLVLDQGGLDRVLAEGAAHVVAALGFGRPEDLPHLESGGRLPEADPHAVSERARQRGQDQLGTLGGGNHFLEVQVVDAVYDRPAADAMGLKVGDLTVLIHTGSRGLGHQVCSDYLKRMDAAAERYGLVVPDRQLACAPLGSSEGRRYFAAMCAAANYAWANRQVLTHRIRDVFSRVLGVVDLPVVYDVAHNVAKIETYGGERLLVHRKGATRAFGPSHPELPPAYRGVGQPVFIPGSMGTASFVLVGRDASADVSLGSCCHGAGRAWSRTEAKRRVAGHVVREALEARGITVRCPSNAELAEEAPPAYKDVERVVAVVERAGIAGRVARLRPVGVLKG